MSDSIRKHEVVVWDDRACRVLKKRRISGLAMFQTGGDYEVLLESLDGEQIGWVGENEVEKISDEAGGA